MNLTIRNILGFLIFSTSLAIACEHREGASSEKPTLSPVPSVSTREETQASRETRRASFKPPKGYVPDEQSAISIAVAVWTPIYGREQIESEKPFKASLKEGVWTVTGTLPEGYNGGTAIAEISQENGCILRVIHEQ
jgi:hypothetical protein